MDIVKALKTKLGIRDEPASKIPGKARDLSTLKIEDVPLGESDGAVTYGGMLDGEQVFVRVMTDKNQAEYEDKLYKTLSDVTHACSDILLCYYGMRQGNDPRGMKGFQMVFRKDTGEGASIGAWLAMRRDRAQFDNPVNRYAVLTLETIHLTMGLVRGLMALHSVDLYHRGISMDDVMLTGIDEKLLSKGEMTLKGTYVKFFALNHACSLDGKRWGRVCLDANQKASLWDIHQGTPLPATEDHLASEELTSVAFFALNAINKLFNQSQLFIADIVPAEFQPKTFRESFFIDYVKTECREYYEGYVTKRPRLNALFQLFNMYAYKDPSAIGIDALMYALVMAYEEISTTMR